MIFENKELILECERKIKDFESKISKCENEISIFMKNNGSVEELSKLIDDFILIFNNINHTYKSLVTKFELYNNGSLIEQIQQDEKLQSFMKVEIAPREVKIIEELNSHIAMHAEQKKNKDILFCYRNVVKKAQNLSLEGQLNLKWYMKRKELERLCVLWEKFQKLPEVIRYLGGTKCKA